MTNSIKQTKKFLYPIVALVVISIVAISSINTYQNIDIFEKYINNHANQAKEKFLEKYTNQIKKQVAFVDDSIKYQTTRVEKELKEELIVRMNIARSICDYVYTTYKDKLSAHQMRTMIAQQLALVRFDTDNRGYYFAYQNSTRTVYEHIHKETIGSYMGDVEDTKGVNVSWAHDNSLKNGDEIGFVKRYFYKPGNRLDGFPKLVSVTLYKPLDLLIGTGEYLDVIEKRLKKQIIQRFNHFTMESNTFLGLLDLHNIDGGDEFATVLASTNNKEQIGKKQNDSLKDAKGIEFRKIYLKMLKKNGESLLKHYYKNPNTKEQKPVTTYCYLQKDWNWIIVSGFYTKNLTKQLQVLEDSLSEYKSKIILDTILFITILSFIVILIAIFISIRINKAIQEYTGEILENKLELEYAQEVAKMGSWKFNYITEQFTVSNETYKIFEIDRKKENLSLSIFKERIHPEDRQKVIDAESNAIQEKSDVSLVYRLLFDNERIKVIQTYGNIVFNEENQALVINGTIQDITQEYTQNKEIREKEKQLMEKEKLASMGEMIGNIAHQWRQPLSIISTSATGMQMKKEFNILEDDELVKNCKIINENAQYLSTTIDDFKNFIKGERKILKVNIKENVESFLHLIEGVLKTNNIEIIQSSKTDKKVLVYPNELIQCYINIFNNSRDAFLSNKVHRKLFFISFYEEKESIVVSLMDNGGGIPKDIITKVFNPYFTTKHQSQGTGIGLNMTYRLITEGLKGNIQVENKTFLYDGIEYKGANFKITIPL